MYVCIYVYIYTYTYTYEAWGSVVEGTTLQVGRTRDRFRAVTLGIYSVAADISVCPGVDSASKNEYQDIPVGKGDLTTLMCQVSSSLEP